MPLAHAPASALDYQGPDIAWSRLEAIERPGTIELRHRTESPATSLHVRFLLGPTTEKGFGVEVARHSVQVIHFHRREEELRDCAVIGVRPDVFEIHTDIGVRGERDQGKIG